MGIIGESDEQTLIHVNLFFILLVDTWHFPLYLVSLCGKKKKS